MTNPLIVVLIAAWAWGWGYWAHECRPFEGLLAATWPVAVPLGKLLYVWRWGRHNNRHRYADMEWWQRGLKERRDSDPKRRMMAVDLDAYNLDVAAVAIWAEVREERIRAHRKHGNTSMEATPADDPLRLAILVEEVGEIAREFNEARHTGTLDIAALRKELIQTAAMAGAWAAVLESAEQVIEQKGTKRRTRRAPAVSRTGWIDPAPNGRRLLTAPPTSNPTLSGREPSPPQDSPPR